MTIDLLRDRGTHIDDQMFTWRDLVRSPISKLDADAFTRVRIILMSGIESEANRFSHACARMKRELQPALARVRRIEQHQQTMVNWLLPADQSPLETTIGLEQVEIEVTASVAESEPDEHMAQIYRFGMLEDFDHMYRFAALMDRVTGKDANNIVQSYSDILPGRPTSRSHRHPYDDLRNCYKRKSADLLTKLGALTVMAAEHRAHDFYMTIGPMFADPVARQLYAEIASIEEQHVTQFESIIDAEETWLEKWLLHEACEVYNYYSCVEYESDPRIRSLWERFLDYELGQLRFVADLFEQLERRDAAQVLGRRLPEPIRYESHRDFIRQVLREEAKLSAEGSELVPRDQESDETRTHRSQLNSEGSPSDAVSEGWVWRPGTELVSDDEQRQMYVSGYEERAP